MQDLEVIALGDVKLNETTHPALRKVQPILIVNKKGGTSQTLLFCCQVQLLLDNHIIQFGRMVYCKLTLREARFHGLCKQASSCPHQPDLSFQGEDHRRNWCLGRGQFGYM